MIPLDLQDGLIWRFKKVFDGCLFKNPKDEYVPLNIYSQHLPAKDKKKESSEFPYLIVRLADGTDSDPHDPNSTKILFIAGVYDRHNNHQGYRDAILIIQTIYESLKRDPVVDKRFELTYPINWAYHDEDTEPYFFAGLETNWEIPKVTRDDVEAMI